MGEGRALKALTGLGLLRQKTMTCSFGLSYRELACIKFTYLNTAYF